MYLGRSPTGRHSYTGSHCQGIVGIGGTVKGQGEIQAVAAGGGCESPVIAKACTGGSCALGVGVIASDIIHQSG